MAEYDINYALVTKLEILSKSSVADGTDSLFRLQCRTASGAETTQLPREEMCSQLSLLEMFKFKNMVSKEVTK